MKTTFTQIAQSRWLQGAAAAAIALGVAAFAPLANAQSGTLSNPNNCTAFTGFTWNGSTLSLSCSAVQPPPPPPQGSSCDTTQSGSFSWATKSGSATPGNTIVGNIVRSGGCKGQYTITFGSDALAYAGVSLSPQSSVSFADASNASQPVTITTSGNTPVGTQVSVYLTGFTSSTSSPQPPIGGTFVGTVTATQVVTPPPVQNSSITYSGALTNNLQIVWGTNESASLAPFLPKDIASYSFVYGGAYGSVVLGAVSNYVFGGVADTEVSISTVPGDFPGPSACDVRVPSSSTSGQGIAAINVWTPGHSVAAFCILNPGTLYYVNVRQVVATPWSSTAASCNNVNGCALRVQPTSLN